MRRSLLAFVGLTGILGGCSTPPPPSSGEVKYAPISAPEAKVKAQKFVAELEGLPPAMRGQFVFAHPQEAYAIGVAGDPELQAKFRTLVGAPAGEAPR